MNLEKIITEQSYLQSKRDRDVENKPITRCKRGIGSCGVR